MCAFKSASTVLSRPVESGNYFSRTKQSRAVCFSAGGCSFRLMVGAHVDDIIVYVRKNACENLFARPEERFPVKKQRELKMYIGFASVRDGNQAW